MSIPQAVLKVDGLGKVYKRHRGFLHTSRVRALQDVSLAVRPGEILGMLGLNGAGKTTFLKLILRLIQPSEGRIELFGHSYLDTKSRQRLGYLPENPALYSFLTVEGLLHLCGQLYGLSRRKTRQRTEELLELLEASEYTQRRLGELSKGMTQRIAIASAFLPEPELVLLDEPLNSLDPVGRRLVRELLESVKRAGTTVFFSSHILLEVEQICDRISILHQGRLARLEDMSAVHEEYASLEHFFLEVVRQRTLTEGEDAATGERGHH